jgi:hypothetical protein
LFFIYGFLVLPYRYNRWLRSYTSCHPTFYALPLLPQVFLEAESVVVAEPEVYALVLAAVEPEVVVLVAEPSPEGTVLAVEPEVAFVAVASVADVAEPQVSADIAVVFDFLIPVSAAVVEADSPGHPMFVPFPSVDCYARSASSVEAVGDQSVRSTIGVRTNCGLCSILSNQGLHHNKNLEHIHNNPSPGYNNVSDTNGLPMDATTSHSRRTSLQLSQGQRKHRSYQVALSPGEVPQTQWAAVGQN